MTTQTAVAFLVTHARNANRAAIAERSKSNDALLIGMYKRKRDLYMIQARAHQGSSISVQASLNGSDPSQDRRKPSKAAFSRSTPDTDLK